MLLQLKLQPTTVPLTDKRDAQKMAAMLEAGRLRGNRIQARTRRTTSDADTNETTAG